MELIVAVGLAVAVEGWTAVLSFLDRFHGLNIEIID